MRGLTPLQQCSWCILEPQPTGQCLTNRERLLFACHIYLCHHLIIIILSCWKHGYRWHSLTTPPYHQRLLVGPRGYIPHPHRGAVYSFELVAQLLLGHAKGSIGEHQLWARRCFSSSVLHVWFIQLESFRKWKVSHRIAAALLGVASRTCSKLLAAFLCSCRPAFFSSRLVSVYVGHLYSSIDTTSAWKKLRFILSVRSDFHMTDSLSIAVHIFASHVLTSVSVDETLLPRKVN